MELTESELHQWNRNVLEQQLEAAHQNGAKLLISIFVIQGGYLNEGEPMITQPDDMSPAELAGVLRHMADRIDVPNILVGR